MSGYEGNPYAVIQHSGRQFRVHEGDELLVDRTEQPAVGQTMFFDRIVLLRDGGSVRVGSPHVEGARVEAEVLGEAKGPKLVVLKFRRRKDSRVKNGHRAKYTRVRVTKILS